MRPPFSLGLLVSLLLPGLASAQATRAQASGEDAAGASLRALVKAVRDSAPELSAIEHRIAALRHAEAQSDVWADPVVSFEYSNMPIDAPYPGEHPMSGLQFKLQQTFPWPGKNPARRATAEARTAALTHELAERRNSLIGMVKRAYFALALSRQLAEVTRAHRELVERYLPLVQARYEVGASDQADLLRLRLLRDQLVDDHLELEREADERVALINATALRPAEASIVTPAVTSVAAPAGDAATLIAAAREGRPRLAQLAAAAHAERRAAQQMDAERRPDVTAFVGYRVRTAVEGGDQGVDFFSVGVALPLPWFWNDARFGEKAAQHRAQERALSASRDAAILEIRAKVEAALLRLSRARDRGRRYREELLPGAKDTLDAVLAAYQVGRADFTALFQTEQQLLAYERTIRMAEAEAAFAAVDLETELGAADARRAAHRER